MFKCEKEKERKTFYCFKCESGQMKDSLIEVALINDLIETVNKTRWAAIWKFFYSITEFFFVRPTSLINVYCYSLLLTFERKKRFYDEETHSISLNQSRIKRKINYNLLILTDSFLKALDKKLTFFIRKTSIIYEHVSTNLSIYVASL